MNTTYSPQNRSARFPYVTTTHPTATHSASTQPTTTDTTLSLVTASLRASLSAVSNDGAAASALQRTRYLQ